MGVQVLSMQRMSFTLFGFIGIQPLIRIAYLDIECRLFFLILLQVKRVEGRPITGDIFQIADLITRPGSIHHDE